MYISKFRLHNYKSFLDSGEIQLSEGINLIVGQNNSGKTALLEALNLSLVNKPHKSLLTLPEKTLTILKESFFEVNICSNKTEIRELLKKKYSNQFGIPFSRGLNSEINNCLTDELILDIKIIEARRLTDIFNQWLLDDGIVTFSIKSNENFQSTLENNFHLYEPDSTNASSYYNFFSLKYDLSQEKYQPYIVYETINHEGIVHEKEIGCAVSQGTYNDFLLIRFYSNFHEKIYRFQAERQNIGHCKYGQNKDLKTDASNLPEVLYTLQNNNYPLFKRYYRHVREIIPSIKSISIHHTSNSEKGELTILTWPCQAHEEAREDLAIPLADCGTGISQVLAIVYVVFMSEERKTIIIDEPSSFLHPGAARKLIEFLKQFPQHQYFISTHSSTIINAALPCNIVQVKYENGESKAFSIDPDVKNNLLNILDEIGVRLSDIFGADNILWVEGETEEKCFPMILQRIKGKSLKGTAIMKAFETGYLDRKKKDRLVEEIIKVYQKVGNQESLFPPMLAFILDREDRTEDQRKAIEKLAPGKIKFIDEKMYENYLIDADAIAAIINEEDKQREETVKVEEIQGYIDRKSNEIDKNAANFLRDLFNYFTETRVDYKKTRHSVLLTEWLIENKEGHFHKLADELEAILENKQ